MDLTVVGAALGDHDDREHEVDQVLCEGLASLAERWTLRDDETGSGEIVHIKEANPARVIVARGYYATPDIPTLSIRAQQLATGEWEMTR